MLTCMWKGHVEAYVYTTPNLENHVHSLLVVRRGVKIQGRKEAMCPRGGIETLGVYLVRTLVVTWRWRL